VQRGDTVFGLKALLVLLPVMVALTYPNARVPGFVAEYPFDRGVGSSTAAFVSHAGTYLLYYLGWEFFFRGFMQLGLRGALESIVDDMSKTYNLNVTLSLKDSSQPLPIGQLAVLVRSVREILINVFKHAEVSEARISCQHLEDRLLICISDQGVGFDPEEVADDARGLPWTQRFGLRSLHERIANIFGTITIDSARGQGTRITLSIPHAPFTMDIPHS
jgi:anti-sigma regulatory factor (Ser/Thr protein kinase)